MLWGSHTRTHARTHAPQSIPLRLFLSGVEGLTPSYRNINNKFSVKYFLNLVLVDEEDRRYVGEGRYILRMLLVFAVRRACAPCVCTQVTDKGAMFSYVNGRYFKQQEVTMWRKDIG